ncbi:FAD-dependent monooxygenase [Tunturibacter psychrotolerans]|uniref:FAD-dependent monooxygenase n=1 Tax=Tunturiibacter psychrotolerans TaxID=3069686 RepID=A0AAU7ZTA9_9BACT
MKTDVLIAGAGPVGLTMASELSRYGLSVRLVDKNTQRTDKSKAIVLWARTLELINRMSPNCADRFIETGLKTESVNILSGSEHIGHADMKEVDSKYKFVVMIPQSDTERLLEEHLATFNIKAERQTELTDFKETSDGVTYVLKHADGSEETAEASWLIGADGAHSIVRHKLNKEFHGSTLLSDWMLADIYLTGVQGTPAINIYWHADGILALFPLQGTRHRIIANVGESSGPIGEGNRPAPTVEDIQRVLDTRGPGGIKAEDSVWRSNFSINERKVDDYRSGRVFVAGDAAHVHSPAGGQGMNTGMQDAFNLTWKLALVSRGICQPEPLLSSYSAERSPVAKVLLEFTGRATEAALLRGGVKQSIRNHVASLVLGFAPVTHTMANLLSEISIGYSDSPLNAHTQHPRHGVKPGKRALIRENEPPVGFGDAPRFALFAESNNLPSALLLKYSALLEATPRAPLSPDSLSLVRPDGYVALATKSGDWNAVDAYLNQFLPKAS